MPGGYQSQHPHCLCTLLASDVLEGARTADLILQLRSLHFASRPNMCNVGQQCQCRLCWAGTGDQKSTPCLDKTHDSSFFRGQTPAVITRIGRWASVAACVDRSLVCRLCGIPLIEELVVAQPPEVYCSRVMLFSALPIWKQGMLLRRQSRL